MSLKNKPKNLDNFIWNTIGGVVSASTSIILLAFVTRNVDINQAGYFSIAFATAQLLLSFGKFGIRAFQATAVNNAISFTAFILNRIITSLGMIVFSVIYVFYSNYNIEKAFIIICVCGIKVTDALEDVLHGELQLYGRIDVAGKLLTFRNLFTIIIFAIVITTTHSLGLTCLVTAVSSLLVCLIINVKALYATERPKLLFEKSQIGNIFKECFPLFIGSFLSILIYNMPKYAIDDLSTEHIQTVYNIIFMPAFVINMMSEFIFKPLLTPLAHLWRSHELKNVKRIILKLLLCLFGITTLVLIGGYICGIPILELVYGISLHSYKKELMLLLLGGGFSATVYLSYNLLTLMRAQNYILSGYIIGVLTAILISRKLVTHYGIIGAAITYLSTEFLMCGYFLLMVWISLIKYSRKN